MPRRSNKIYVFGREAFVPHPAAMGLWIKTDLSVVKVACPYPGCGSAIGVPCRATSARVRPDDPPSYVGYTHWWRRKEARGKGRDWKNLKMIIVEGTP